MAINQRRLVRMLIAGGFAGLVVFLVFNPGLAKDEEKLNRLITGQILDLDAAMQALNQIKSHLTTPDPFGAFMFTGTFAAMVGSLLVIVDEMSTVLRRVLPKVLKAAIGGMLIGGVIGVGLDFIGTNLARISLLLFPIGQLFLFPMIGFAAGLSLGLSLGSRRRLLLAMGGGLVGGVVGGIAFEAIGSMTVQIAYTGSIGRFLSFIAMGAIIGASVAFVEENGKRSWVTVLNGPKEGREYILSKATTIIGRDELVDIPLFGDPSVAKDHAHLAMMGYLVALQATGGEVSVNGNIVRTAYLKPSDTICIGGHTLRFHQRWEYRGTPQVHYQPVAHQQVFHNVPQQQQQPSYVPAQTSAFPAAAAGSLAMTVSSGPHAGQMFQLPPGTHHIGRETTCAVFLPHDTVVSRTHAELSWDGAHWIVRDLGSRHGLWVNGVRTTEHTLNVGDQIGIGQTWLRVESI